MIRALCLVLVLGAAAGCARSTDSSQPAPAAAATLDVAELSATDARDRMAAGTLT
jgi:hypothetical protein